MSSPNCNRLGFVPVQVSALFGGLAGVRMALGDHTFVEFCTEAKKRKFQLRISHTMRCTWLSLIDLAIQSRKRKVVHALLYSQFRIGKRGVT